MTSLIHCTNVLHSVSASIGSIDVTGVSHDSHETMMVTADDRSVVKGTDPLVHFQLELNPLDRENMDLIVKTNVRPLKVIYNEVGVVMYYYYYMYNIFIGNY